ncbi:hypothetical protein [Aliivibrio kagoshimensis]|uniref:hypothetical protein n=1 Tax=Aliivibrio kagoshimensis TaxID=2910230 RepID=UPI003D0F0991
MTPQINADQGFKRRHTIFIDTPLLHFFEDELLPKTQITAESFYEVLSTIIAEFGGKHRKMMTQKQQSISGTASTNQKLELYRRVFTKELLTGDDAHFEADEWINTINTTTEAVLDEYCCEIPDTLLDTLMIATISTMSNHSAKANHAIHRIYHLTPEMHSAVESSFYQSLFRRIEMLLNIPTGTVKIALTEHDTEIVAAPQLNYA